MRIFTIIILILMSGACYADINSDTELNIDHTQKYDLRINNNTHEANLYIDSKQIWKYRIPVNLMNECKDCYDYKQVSGIYDFNNDKVVLLNFEDKNRRNRCYLYGLYNGKIRKIIAPWNYYQHQGVKVNDVNGLNRIFIYKDYLPPDIYRKEGNLFINDGASNKEFYKHYIDKLKGILNGEYAYYDNDDIKSGIYALYISEDGNRKSYISQIIDSNKFQQHISYIARRYLAMIYLEENKINMAKSELKKIAIFNMGDRVKMNDVSNDEIEGFIYENLGDYYLSNSDVKNAISNYENAIGYYEKYEDERFKRRSRSIKTRYRLIKKQDIKENEIRSSPEYKSVTKYLDDIKEKVKVIRDDMENGQ